MAVLSDYEKEQVLSLNKKRIGRLISILEQLKVANVHDRNVHISRLQFVLIKDKKLEEEGKSVDELYQYHKSKENTLTNAEAFLYREANKTFYSMRLKGHPK